MGEISKGAKRITLRGDDNEVTIAVPDFETLLSLFGTNDRHLAGSLLKGTVCSTAIDGSPNSVEKGELVVAIIRDLKPDDAIERLLASQLAMTHVAMMNTMTKMNASQHVEALEVFDRSYNRLARAFTAQIEALRRHRTGGHSKVTVEHVTVNSGGQAIVGNVEHGRGGQ